MSPPSHPISGIIAWNDPKNIAIFKALLILTFSIAIPLATDTAKASAASPNAMKIVATMSIWHYLCRVSLSRLTLIFLESTLLTYYIAKTGVVQEKRRYSHEDKRFYYEVSLDLHRNWLPIRPGLLRKL